MKRINAAIEVADGDLCAQELRAQAETECGARIVLNPKYADRLVLVVRADEHADALEAALKKFGVIVATPGSLCDALCDPSVDECAAPRKRLRLMFREFKSNPLSKVDLRGKDPADPLKRERKHRAKRFKEDFYGALSEFIADHPSLPYKDYWDADGRPYDRQWPEYRAAVREAKAIRADREPTTRRRGGCGAA